MDTAHEFWTGLTWFLIGAVAMAFIIYCGYNGVKIIEEWRYQRYRERLYAEHWRKDHGVGR